MPILIPRTSTQITLDANGNGQTTFAIDNTNARWVLDEIHVFTDQALTATPIPSVKTYKNAVTPQGFQGGTFSGQLGYASGRVVLYPDDVLYVVWTGGIPSTHAWATIGGTFDRAGAKIQDD